MVGAILCACNSPKSKDVENTEPIKNDLADNTVLVAKGNHLVAIMGCNDCHSPKKMTPTGPMFDTERLLSGHPSDEVLGQYDSETLKNYVLFTMDLTAAIGPWGTTYAANLTPDETGIGSWTEEQFSKAVKEGKWRGLDGTRQLLPPMPWQTFANLSDDDIKAIYAYLRSLKPVKNAVPLAKIAMAP